jgi:hypothetical protein
MTKTILFLMPIIAGLLLLGIALIFANINTIGFNLKDSSHFAFAQVNSPNGSSTTIIGNVKIPPPPLSNGTKTTLSGNATGANATGIHKANLAENITSANALIKENITAPISPTGISTQSRHVPPSNQISNIQNTDK